MQGKEHVHVVDRDPQLRSQIQQLSTELDATWSFYDDAEQFLAKQRDQASGCVVADFRLEGMCGLRLPEELRRRRLAWPLVFVATQPRTHEVVRAMQDGAVTVLEKPTSAGDLLAALDLALSKSRTLLRIDSRHAVLRDRLARLTPKEEQVLDMVMVGKPNKVIARRLGVSLRTVEVRRQNIFRKTETRSVAELVQLVLEARDDEPSPAPDCVLVM